MTQGKPTWKKDRRMREEDEVFALLTIRSALGLSSCGVSYDAEE